MKNWKSLLLLALVFVAGLAVGVAGTRIVVRRTAQQAAEHPERTQFAVEHNLARRLRLDNDQRAKLRAILTDAREQMSSLRKDYQPKANAVLHSTDQKISALLTPDQQTRYESFKEHSWPAMLRLRAGTLNPPPINSH